MQLQAGTPIDIALTSSQFDVYLGLLDPVDEVVLEVDDSPDRGLDVFETFTPASSGSFAVVVSSARPSETGSYQLAVTPAGASAPQGGDQNPLGQGAGQDPAAGPVPPFRLEVDHVVSGSGGQPRRRPPDHHRDDREPREGPHTVFDHRRHLLLASGARRRRIRRPDVAGNGSSLGLYGGEGARLRAREHKKRAPLSRRPLRFRSRFAKG